MYLTLEEQKILSGQQGPALQKAMEIVFALGQIYSAKCLIPITSAQISGVSYKNLGSAGLEFLQEWSESGAQVSVPSTLNPAGMDLDRWQELGFHQDFAEKQKKVISAYQRFGIPPVCSCTPYLFGNLPRFGDHIAWAESSAVAFANSVLGARTNREGGPSALAAAILGKTAEYGLHLDENRRANYLIIVECNLQNEADYSALGYYVGQQVSNGIPYFRGITKATLTQLKSLGAAMAASGAVALFHIEGITPEAKMYAKLDNQISTTSSDPTNNLPHTLPFTSSLLTDSYQTIHISSLADVYHKLNQAESEIDLVAIGCPHASYEEIKQIAQQLQGKKIKTKLWITTAETTRQFAYRSGLEKIICEAGGVIVSDTCMIVAPLQDFGFRTMATNSGKAAYYAPSHCGIKVRFGSLEVCLTAAITGRFPDVG